MKNIKVIFMGTPTFAVPILKVLNEMTNVVLVVSQPDREKDRKGNILPTPIKKIANELDIEVLQPTNIKEEINHIKEIKPDIIITCAYGQMIPEEILECPPYGCINVHGSLLPKLRGGAPIHHAIIDGENKTGITIMYMDKQMDSGDIIFQEKIDIYPNDTLDSLYERMSQLGAKTLQKTLPTIIDGSNQRIKQDNSLVTYGLNITKEEEKIDFNQNSINIHNRIRGLSSIPGAYCYFKNKRLKIYQSELTTDISNLKPGTISKIDKTGIYVSTKDYIIKLIDIKLEGKKRCHIKDFINGIKEDEYIGKVLNNE